MLKPHLNKSGHLLQRSRVVQIIEMPPIAIKTLIIIVIILSLAIIITILATRPTTFEVTSKGLRIRNILFGRMIPVPQLRADGARIIDFAISPELRPKWRTLGVSLPGYQAGWFRLYNGEKALVFLTRAKQTVYIPTTMDYSLLVSVENPATFLSSLRGFDN